MSRPTRYALFAWPKDRNGGHPMTTRNPRLLLAALFLLGPGVWCLCVILA